MAMRWLGHASSMSEDWLGNRSYGKVTGPPAPRLRRTTIRRYAAKVGGAKRDRTADLLNAIQALSQLSYGPVHEKRNANIRNAGVLARCSVFTIIGGICYGIAKL